MRRREEVPLLRRLKEHDAQLALLALLTVEGIKPASRWEKALPPALLETLRDLGLAVGTVRRLTRRGPVVEETVFARDSERMQGYLHQFDGRPIAKNRETRRLEGIFFGYPPCCVEAFAEHPYSPNGLPPEDQALLFHWACPGCLVTPCLLAAYRIQLAILRDV
ncbi:MAG: hypothetical protein AB1486_07365 [Planctomycetota bacterium]